MTTLTPFTPFSDLFGLRDAMNTLFDETLAPTGNGRSQGPWTPLDISETRNGFMIEIALPGIKVEDIDLTFQDNVLTISGELKQPQYTGGNEKPNYHRVERRYGRFARSITFPTQVEPDAVQAKLENGVLWVFVPKAEAVKPRKISITSGQTHEAKQFGVNNEQHHEELEVVA